MWGSSPAGVTCPELTGGHTEVSLPCGQLASAASPTATGGHWTSTLRRAGTRARHSSLRSPCTSTPSSVRSLALTSIPVWVTCKGEKNQTKQQSRAKVRTNLLEPGRGKAPAGKAPGAGGAGPWMEGAACGCRGGRGKVSAAGAPPGCGPALGTVAGIGGRLAAGQAKTERQQRLNPLPCCCGVGRRPRRSREPPGARPPVRRRCQERPRQALCPPGTVPAGPARQPAGGQAHCQPRKG